MLLYSVMQYNLGTKSNTFVLILIQATKFILFIFPSHFLSLFYSLLFDTYILHISLLSIMKFISAILSKYIKYKNRELKYKYF